MKVAQAAFVVACFWGFSDVHEWLGGLSISPQQADSLLQFITWLADEFGHGFVWYVRGSENGTNGCHMTVFSVDVAFANHFVAPPL